MNPFDPYLFVISHTLELVRTAKRYTKDIDIAQDALEHVLKKSLDPIYRQTIKDERWIYKVLINKVIELSRKKKEKPFEEEYLNYLYEVEQEDEIDFIEKSKGLRDEVMKFIYEDYPIKTADKYAKYFEIYCQRILEEKSWENMQKEYPEHKMIIVRNRVSKLLSRFRTIKKPKKHF